MGPCNPVDRFAPGAKARRSAPLRDLLAERATAVLRAFNVEGRVAAADVVRGPTARAQRDLGVFSWYARVRGGRCLVTVGSQLAMRACARAPLVVEHEPLTESFHLYPPAEWPPGLSAPPGGVLGVRDRFGRVRWHDADGLPVPSDVGTRHPSAGGENR